MGTLIFVFQAKTEQIPVETEQNVTDENGDFNHTISTYFHNDKLPLLINKGKGSRSYSCRYTE